MLIVRAVRRLHWRRDSEHLLAWDLLEVEELLVEELLVACGEWRLASGGALVVEQYGDVDHVERLGL
jgi:hypothetical protein